MGVGELLPKPWLIQCELLWKRCGKRRNPVILRDLFFNLDLKLNMPAGYSATPLLNKLGIKPGMKLLVINQPDDYFTLLEIDISDQFAVKDEIPDLVHLFVKTVNNFEVEMKKLKVPREKNTSIIIWVSWYKKSSRIPTDITEDVIRIYALKNNLVDIKVCAVSDIWSGLKLVVPVNKR